MQTNATELSSGRSPDPGVNPRQFRRLGVLALVCSLAVIGLLLSIQRSNGHDSGLAVGAASADVTVPPTTGTITVTPPSSLPIPDALPKDARAPADDIVVGHLEIPKIGISEDIHQGMTLTAIDRGPGWWPNTAMPGELGNVVIAGHRVTHSKPFNRLDELTEGDQVIFTTDDGRFVYQVRGVIVVPDEWIDIAAQDWAHTATLFACHPKGSATHRIVAKLRLLEDDGTPADPDAALPALNAEELRTEHTLVTRAADDGQPSSDSLAGVDG